MSRSRKAIRLSIIWAVAFAFMGTLTGCPKDPYDAQTWIDKLDDASEVDRAITELQRLKDPKAIQPLAKVWRKQNRSQRVLRVIIELAENTDNNGPHWDKAIPVLVEAIEGFDVGDARSIENATFAADALGKAKNPEAIEPLIAAVNQSMPALSPGQRVRLAAVTALGNFGDEPRAVGALIKVISADEDKQRIELFGAAINAVAQTRSEKALPSLLEALFKISPLYQQVRRALIGIGRPAAKELILIFKGEHKEINALAKKYKFNTDCSDSNMGPDTSCQAPTNLEFKSASMLGDFYARDAVPTLLAGLKAPSLPSFFQDDVPGPSQHTAILDALRKIGDSSAAGPVLDYWKNTNDVFVRPLAIDVYSYLTAGTEGLKDLGALLSNDGAEQQARLSAAMAYGRLAREPGDLTPLTDMVAKYKKVADEAEGKAAGPQKTLDAAKKALDDALAAQTKAGGSKAAPEDVKAAYKKASDAFDKAQDVHRPLASRAAGMRNFQRTFEQNIARAAVAFTCKSDPACYADQLSKTTADIVKGLSLDKYIDLKPWSEEEKGDLKVAVIERSLIELGKMGEKARPVVPKLLEHVGSADRITRQGVLMALVHSAQLPCTECVDKLTATIIEQKDQSTLAALSVETEAVRNYFWWAGK